MVRRLTLVRLITPVIAGLPLPLLPMLMMRTGAKCSPPRSPGHKQICEQE